MAYKALWSAAGKDYQTQTTLLNAARNDIQAGKAAIWALFNASRNYQVQNSLIDIVKDGYENEYIRIAAVKSPVMGHYRIKV